MQPILSVRNFIVSAITLWFCSSCQSTSLPPASAVLTKDNLAEQLFIINTGKDTTLLTTAGIRIHIPAGSIKSNTASVTVVVKEALTLYDILRAGLTTRSGDQLLRSNGMFYIGTKENANLLKPLQTEVPATFADPAMQLFKGAEVNGRIDWQSPQPLSVDTLKGYTYGKSIFENNCASCHGVKYKLTGPALAHVESRFTNRAHLYQCIRNSQDLIRSGECAYFSCQYCQYKIAMNSFGNFTDYDIECVLAYIKRETKNQGIPDTVSVRETEVDECMYGLQKLMADSGPVKQDSSYWYSPDVKVKAANGTVGGKYNESPAEYYNLGIHDFGWNNIDVYLHNSPGIITASLKAIVKGSTGKSFNAFLIIPDDMLFTEGVWLKDRKEYVFYEADGSIPLKLSKQAYIIAVGAINGKLFWGMQPFVTAQQQTVDVVVAESDKAKIASALLQISNGRWKLPNTQNKNQENDNQKEFQQIYKLLDKAGCSCWYK